MSLLTLQGPAQRGRDPRKIVVPTNSTATFGVCECGDCGLDLRLRADSPVQFRGQVLAGTRRWRIENLSEHEPLAVIDVDGGIATAALPGESLPFTRDMALIRPLDGEGDVSLTLFFTPSTSAEAPLHGGCPAIAPQADPDLDPGARYFAVLVALCEEELLDRPSGPVPTSSDIAKQLMLSPRAVDSHIDYLVEKFAIPAPATRSTGWKRRALITYVRGHDGVARDLRRARRRAAA